MLESSTQPLTCGESCWGPAAVPDIILSFYSVLVGETLEALTLGFVFSHRAPPENVRRLSRVQCMCESISVKILRHPGHVISKQVQLPMYTWTTSEGVFAGQVIGYVYFIHSCPCPYISFSKLPHLMFPITTISNIVFSHSLNSPLWVYSQAPDVLSWYFTHVLYQLDGFRFKSVAEALGGGEEDSGRGEGGGGGTHQKNR